MAKKKLSKSAQVRLYMAKHPGARAAEIAKSVGVPPGLVYNVRALDKKKNEGASKSTPTRRRSVAPSKSGENEILMAANFVQSCGGLSEARKALDAVEQVAKALG